MKGKLVPIAVIVALLGLVAVVFFSPRPIRTIYSENIEKFKTEGVPNFELFNSQLGNSFNLKDQTAELILVNFWASWCAPCVEEFKPLVELALSFKSHDLLVVAISEDDDLSKLDIFIKENLRIRPPNFVLLHDKGGAVAKLYGTKKLPETYFFGRDRKLKMKILSGQNWKSYDIKKYFSSFLGSEK